MIRINLLPVRAFKRKENVRLQVSIFFIILVGLIAALILVRFDKANQVDELLLEKQKLIKRWEAQQKALEVLAIEKQTMALLNKRISIIIDLIKQRSGPVQLLDELIKRTPHGEIWLTELVQQTETIKETVPVVPPKPPARRPAVKRITPQTRKAAVKQQIITAIRTKRQAPAAQPKVETKEVQVLTLKGIAKNNQFIAQYINSLENSALIENVKLVNSRETKIGNQRLKQFIIKCVVNYLKSGQKAQKETTSNLARR